MQLRVQLHPEPFEALKTLDDWQRMLAEGPEGPPPAEACFIGRVRHHSQQGEPLAGLELEHYPGMTDRCLAHEAQRLGRFHAIQAILIHHRVGLVAPGEVIVLVSVAADRRGPAQRCCQELLEALKHDAPFWKREHRRAGGGHWLDGNTLF